MNTKNYETLFKELKNGTNKSDIPYTCIERLKNVHTTQSNLQMQCNPYKNPNDFLNINIKKILKST